MWLKRDREFFDPKVLDFPKAVSTEFFYKRLLKFAHNVISDSRIDIILSSFTAMTIYCVTRYWIRYIFHA